MAKKSKNEALGKGIRALLENLDNDQQFEKGTSYGSPVVGTINTIPLDDIEINPFQPRADFDAEKLTELSDSIKIHGVIQPVTVRQLTNNHFQLIAGERRIRAAKLAGLTEIPAYIRNANDQEMLEIGLIENIQRENLNAIEIAINYKRLIDECSLAQEELAHRVGKNRTTVTNYLRLLKLPPEIQLGLKSGKISMGHARALINISDIGKQLKVFKEIIAKDMSVRQAEHMVRELEVPKINKQRKTITLPPSYQSLQDKLANQLSTRVVLKPKTNFKGEIVISYSSIDDLNRLVEILESDG